MTRVNPLRVGGVYREAAMKPNRFAGLLACMPLLLVAGGAARAADTGPTLRGDVHVGEALARRWCNDCHLVGGARRGTDAAPPFAAIAGDPSKTVDRLRAFMSKPHPPMPPIPLSGAEVEDLIAYIRSLGR